VSSKNDRLNRHRKGGSQPPDVMVVRLGVHYTDAEIIGVMRQVRGARAAHEKGGKCLVATCVIMGYDDDPRELDQIPEVRALCARLWELGLPSFLEVFTSVAELTPRPLDGKGCGLGLGAYEVWQLANGRSQAGLPKVVLQDDLKAFMEKELAPLNSRADRRLADCRNN